MSQRRSLRSPNCRTRRARSSMLGSKKRKAARRRLRPASVSPPPRSPRLASRARNDPRRLFSDRRRFAGAWLADRPGDVVLTWQGRQFETSLMVVTVAILALFVALILILALIALLLGSPFMLRRHLRRGRGERAY